MMASYRLPFFPPITYTHKPPWIKAKTMPLFAVRPRTASTAAAGSAVSTSPSPRKAGSCARCGVTCWKQPAVFFGTCVLYVAISITARSSYDCGGCESSVISRSEHTAAWRVRGNVADVKTTAAFFRNIMCASYYTRT